MVVKPPRARARSVCGCQGLFDTVSGEVRRHIPLSRPASSLRGLLLLIKCPPNGGLLTNRQSTMFRSGDDASAENATMPTGFTIAGAGVAAPVLRRRYFASLSMCQHVDA